MSVPTDPPARLSSRAGFALPLAILAIAMLTAAVAAGFAATASEAVVTNAQRAQERAYQLAEAGLQQFLVRRSESGFCTGCVADPTAAVDSEYTRVSLNGGYADVVAKRIWNPDLDEGSPMFFIRSRGVDTTALLGGSGGIVYAERTVGLYARWSSSVMQVLAPLTSFNGLSRPNGAGTEGDVNRDDYCNEMSNADEDVMTVTGAGTSIAGSPGLSWDDDPFADVVTAQAIDWSSILAGGISPSRTIPSDAWPSDGNTDWPIIRVTTSAAGVLPTGSRQALIVADSDVTIPKGSNWRGIVLIGGRLITESGNNGSDSDIYGAVVTGLNRLLPGAPADNGTGDNDVLLSNRYTIRYNSCDIASAGSQLVGYIPLSNSWMDNVATW